MKEHLVYLRENNNPIACVAVRNNGSDSAYQLSTLSHKDRFDKVLARTIAIGRLAKKPIPIDLSGDMNFHQTMNRIAQVIVQNESLPTRSRKAAYQYLVDHVDSDTTIN